MPKNILDQLKTECPFPEMFQDMEKPERSFISVPRRKIGHIRADHDGRRWWNTVWPCHPELETLMVTTEIDQVYNALTGIEALADFDTLVDFCQSHPEARVHPTEGQEYNFYLEGEHCNFWVRLITRWRDYNMYLNAFTKDG